MSSFILIDILLAHKTTETRQYELEICKRLNGIFFNLIAFILILSWLTLRSERLQVVRWQGERVGGYVSEVKEKLEMVKKTKHKTMKDMMN